MGRMGCWSIKKFSGKGFQKVLEKAALPPSFQKGDEK